MKDCVRALCILSVFCGAALSLCPEGGGKRVLRVLETAVLLAVILRGLGQLDLSPYTAELAKLHEKELELSGRAEALESRLDSLVIEEEYRAYFEKRAETCGVGPIEVHIRARWNKDGLWVPDSASIRLSTDRGKEELSRILTGDLGIPAEKQEWIIDERLEDTDEKAGGL